MTLDMHDSFVVRMPPMTVLSIKGNNIELNPQEKPQFRDALKALYTLAGTQWPEKFYVQKPPFKTIVQGSLVLVYAKPSKNNNQIVWEAQKIHCTRTNPRVVGQAAVAAAKEAAKEVAAAKEAAKEQTVVASHEVQAGAAQQKKRTSDTLDNWLGVQTKKQCK